MNCVRPEVLFQHEKPSWATKAGVEHDMRQREIERRKDLSDWLYWLEAEGEEG